MNLIRLSRYACTDLLPFVHSRATILSTCNRFMPTLVHKTYSTSQPVTDSTQEFLGILNEATTSSQASKVNQKSNQSKQSADLGEDNELPIDDEALTFAEHVDIEGLDLWGSPFALCQKCIELVHDNWGCSWAASILLTGVAVRLIFSPAHFVAERGFTARFSDKEKNRRFLEEYEKSKLTGDKKAIKAAFLAHRTYQQSTGMLSYRGYLINGSLLLLPMWVHSTASHVLAQCNAGNMLNEPFFWVKHLALPDPLGILPTLNGTLLGAYILLNVTREISAKTSVDRLTLGLQYLVVPFCCFIICRSFLHHLPAATNLSLSLHIGFSLSTVLLFRLPVVRRLFQLANFEAVSALDVVKTRLQYPGKREELEQKARESRQRVELAKENLKLVFKSPIAFREKYVRSKKEELTKATEAAAQMKAKSGK